MYLDFLGLSHEPFQLTADPRFLYFSKAHARAKAYMNYGLLRGDGLVVITGEVGSGKTTLVQHLLSRLEERVLCAKIDQTQLTETQFLKVLLVELGLRVEKANKVELLDELNRFLIEQHTDGRKVILVVDEAQNLSPRVLEELRLLWNLEVQNERILNVILVGQPQLDELLDSPGMEPLVQRIRLRYRISALDDKETKEYIAHRLAVAGNTGGQIFTTDAMALIYGYTGGIPRLINVLCDLALTSAFANNSRVISAKIIKTAVEELQWVAYADRPSRDRPPHHKPEAMKPYNREAASKLHSERRDLLDRSLGAAFYHLAVLRLNALEAAKSIGRKWRIIPLKTVTVTLVTMGVLFSILGLVLGTLGSDEIQKESAQQPPLISENPVSMPDQPLDGREGTPFEANKVTRIDEAELTPVVPEEESAADTEPAAEADSAQAENAESPEDTEPPSRALAVEPFTPSQVSQSKISSLAVEGPGEDAGPTSNALAADSPVPSEAPQAITTALSDERVPSKDETVIKPEALQKIPGLRPVQWLLDQNPERYAIQILGVSEKAALQQFVVQQDLDMEMAYFPSRRHGKEWYVLLAGTYPSHTAANSARRALPNSVRANRPWIRKLDDVQKHIRTMR